MSTPSENGDLLNFAKVIEMHEDGSFNHDLTNDLREVVAAMNQSVIDHGGVPTGEINITLKLRMEGGVIEMRADHKVKKPKRARPKAVYWSSAGNNLTMKNPKQNEFAFGVRDVTSRDAGEVRSV